MTSTPPNAPLTAVLTRLLIQPSDGGEVRTYLLEFMVGEEAYTMTVDAHPEWLRMEPDDRLAPCLDTFSEVDEVNEATDPELMRKWCTGQLADEMMGTLAESGLLSLWSASPEDSDES